MISNQTDEMQPEGHPQAVVVEDSIVHGQLFDWDIEVANYLPMTAAMHGKDRPSTSTLCRTESHRLCMLRLIKMA